MVSKKQKESRKRKQKENKIISFVQEQLPSRLEILISQKCGKILTSE